MKRQQVRMRQREPAAFAGCPASYFFLLFHKIPTFLTSPTTGHPTLHLHKLCARCVEKVFSQVKQGHCHHCGRSIGDTPPPPHTECEFIAVSNETTGIETNPTVVLHWCLILAERTAGGVLCQSMKHNAISWGMRTQNTTPVWTPLVLQELLEQQLEQLKEIENAEQRVRANRFYPFPFVTNFELVLKTSVVLLFGDLYAFLPASLQFGIHGPSAQLAALAYLCQSYSL